MKAILSRNYKQFQTMGSFYLFEKDYPLFSCKTLELLWKDNKKNISCIPEGVYDVKKITRPDGRPGLHIQNVPGRSSILLHAGSFAAGEKVDIEGCILTGTDYKDINNDGHLDIVESVTTFDRLYALLPNTFKLYII